MMSAHMLYAEFLLCFNRGKVLFSFISISFFSRCNYVNVFTKIRDISASIKFVSFTSGVELNRWCHQEVKALLYLVQYAV